MDITVTVTEARAIQSLLDSYGDFDPCYNEAGDCNDPGSPGCASAWHPFELDVIDAFAAKLAEVIAAGTPPA